MDLQNPSHLITKVSPARYTTNSGQAQRAKNQEVAFESLICTLDFGIDVDPTFINFQQFWILFQALWMFLSFFCKSPMSTPELKLAFRQDFFFVYVGKIYCSNLLILFMVGIFYQ